MIEKHGDIFSIIGNTYKIFTPNLEWVNEGVIKEMTEELSDITDADKEATFYFKYKNLYTLNITVYDKYINKRFVKEIEERINIYRLKKYLCKFPKYMELNFKITHV